MSGPVLLLDAASLYYRAFYGVPDRRDDPASPPNNAVRGFLDMIATLVSAHRPSGLVACWDDDWRPAFRVEAIPTYKTHRLADDSAVAEDTPRTSGRRSPSSSTPLRPSASRASGRPASRPTTSSAP